MSDQDVNGANQDADELELVDTDVRDSNPNAAGSPGLTGGMGVSSERTGPYGSDPAVAGVQGTGTHGSAAHSTDGVSNTSRADVPGAPAASGATPLAPAHGPEMDDTQQRATQSWRDTQPPVDPDASDQDSHDQDASEGASPATGLDRTVGEANTAEVPGHDFDPTRNPGHSHG